jgi:transposase
MNILALDLGKFKSVACDYDTATSNHEFTTIQTSPQMVHDLLVEREPDRLVIEVCGIAGWVHDLAVALEIEVQVANPNTEGWRWKKVKRKTDREDALKLAKLSAMNQLPLVYIPSRQTRQWRSLIGYRHKLVDRRTAIFNSIRAVLDREGLSMPSGDKGWTRASLSRLRSLSCPVQEVEAEQLWRGQLHVELQMLAHLAGLLKKVETKLDALGRADERVRRLRTVPGVGPRLSELVVAIVDDPHRFRNGRQVGAYAGLVPRQHQSGTQDRLGRITHRGPNLLRKVLVEIAWAMRRHNPRAMVFYERICKGQKTRRKQAAVALARKVLIWCWAMLRDETEWCGSRAGRLGKAEPVSTAVA